MGKTKIIPAKYSGKMEAPRFDLVWRGEVKEDGTEIPGHTIACSKTIAGIRAYCKLKKITDFDHAVHQIGFEIIHGLQMETTIAEYKIKK